jgi:hypothetical protein
VLWSDFRAADVKTTSFLLAKQNNKAITIQKGKQDVYLKCSQRTPIKLSIYQALIHCLVVWHTGDY